MAALVCSSSMCQCSLGSCPSAFSCLPVDMVSTGGMPVGTIFDTVPMLNIKPFGACSAMSGLPCTPAPAGTWLPSNTLILVKGKPILLSDSMLMCSIGGMIKISVPAQMMVNT